MIYEMRTYTLQPGMVPEFLNRFEKSLEDRLKKSKLTAFFYTESGAGELNQVIHIWEYEDADHRMEIRKSLNDMPNWPPPVRDLVVKQESRLMSPAPFPEKPLEGELGNIYEIRTYTFQPGKIPLVIERWDKIIHERMKISPLAACWFTEFGPLNTWTHVWPYKSFQERIDVRKAQAKLDGWPPDTREFMLSQENRRVIPAPFSPMR